MARFVKINLDEECVEFGDEPINLLEYLDGTLAALTAMVKTLQDKTENFDNRECYDLCNERMGKFFEITFPDIEMHPEITQELLQKESQYVARKAKALDKRERRKRKREQAAEITSAELNYKARRG